jgi:hypothetical protein
MKNETELLQEAIDALQAQDKSRARKILAHIIRDNPQNDRAWMYTAFAVDTVDQKIECLQRAIEINPANEKAEELISRLEAKTQSQTSVSSTKSQAKRSSTKKKGKHGIGHVDTLHEPPQKPRPNRSQYVTIPLFILLVLAALWLYVEVGRIKLPTLQQSVIPLALRVDTNTFNISSLSSDISSMDSELNYVRAVAEHADSYAHSHTWSDSRLKKSVSTISNALENIAKLRGVVFFWNTEIDQISSASSNPQIGFIAQEVEEIYPELVSTGADGYKGIDYAKITPILVEAIKEQQTQISELQQQNAALEARITELESIAYDDAP